MSPIWELLLVALGYAIKHAIGMRRWWKIRGAALAILSAPEGTNDPKTATEQATLLIEQPKIQTEAIAVARTRSASLPPPMGQPPTE
jgi:hypothetical protein